MGVTVRIPTPLRRLTKGLEEVKAEGNTVAEVIDYLDREFPGMKERICDENGEVKKFVNIYVNQEDIRFLDNITTKLKDGDEISIVPAIAGGVI